MAKLVKTKVEVEGEVSEEYALVQEPLTTPWDVEEELKVVGKPVPRVDGEERASGAAHYPSDIRLPGMLHAKFLRSPYPHARVRRIDTSRAEQLPGVRAVMSKDNAPATPWNNKRPIFDDVARFAGDEVAAVAADTLTIARQALRLIQVDYEPLPFVLDPEAALHDDAPKIYPDGNLLDGEPTKYERGDVELALAEADVVVEGTFETPTQVHNSLETHGSVVTWEGDQVVVYDSTQNVFGVRDCVARWLGLDRNRVRVVKQFMGGGFGSKLGTGKYTVAAALLAKRTGRPIRFFLDRTEENIAAGHRHATRQYLRVGAKRDGTLLAIDLRSYTALGAYSAWGAAVGGPARELYNCANVRTYEYNVFTNIGPQSAFRAPGYVEGMFGLEILMDELAGQLGMDPLELRIKNYAARSPLNNLPYSSNGLLDTYEEGARAIGWDKRQQLDRTGTRRRGIGMASQIWGGAGAPPSYARVQVQSDASVTVITGTQDIGTGTKTILAQITAEELGVPLDKIRVEIGDSEWGLYSILSGGSMTAATVGPAVREAAADAKGQLINLAAQFLQVRPSTLTLNDGVIRGVKRRRPIEKRLAEILGELGDIMVIGNGSRAPNPDGVAIRTFGAQFVEVEVDIETGAVRVIKVVASHDCGRILNPLTTSSQIEGGVLQGMGYALMEQQIVDPKTGVVVNPNLENYFIPTMLDVPEIQVHMIDRADPNINNLGAKGVGEPPIIPTAPAIVNAVYDAIGIRFRSIPLTRDRVLDALERQQTSDIRQQTGVSG
ncbi:MAG: xanthine dehydrogenase family protein molybdopterin-binding subunit [Chloroflexi bacterium]|nr:xanthine dehydrogenase family protein molybdopterin-binding subunit [Chloroflexota bacterium]